MSEALAEALRRARNGIQDYLDDDTGTISLEIAQEEIDAALAAYDAAPAPSDGIAAGMRRAIAMCLETRDEALAESGPCSREIAAWMKGQADAILAAIPAAGAWEPPAGFFLLGGDARLRQCASDGCFQHVSYRMEIGGVGSEYCTPCAKKIAAQIPPAPAGEGEG